MKESEMSNEKNTQEPQSDPDTATRDEIETIELTRSQILTPQGGKLYLMRFALVDQGKVAAEHYQLSIVPACRPVSAPALYSVQLHLDELELLGAHIEASIQQMKSAERHRSHEQRDNFALTLLARLEEMATEVMKKSEAPPDAPEEPPRQSDDMMSHFPSPAETIDADFDDQEKTR